ncbi:hypothetical protein [Alkalicoccobacillus plakortidis]|uniref:Uncharacterized protein n=1 Tax=Alkalicoccobacillus plakortidis TaxID=444060 RepID=A0ABT0XDU4_9BACI|nr:hypothetical protein [Alkalicoccobacillus plakortidis]MCM2674075.1 hypothetical protein [Alkalicoccobacillus plakortidis]
MEELSFNAYFNWFYKDDDYIATNEFKVLKKRLLKQKEILSDFLFFPVNLQGEVTSHTLYFFNEKWLITLLVSKEYELVVTHQSLLGIDEIYYGINPYGHRVLKVRKENKDLFDLEYKGSWPSKLKDDYQSNLDEIHDLLTK